MLQRSMRSIVTLCLIFLLIYTGDVLGQSCTDDFDCPMHDPCEQCQSCIIVFPATVGTCSGAVGICVAGTNCDVTNACSVCDDGEDCDAMDCGDFPDDGNECTTARCLFGICEHLPNQDPCDTMDACMLDGQCNQGMCEPQSLFECPDTDPTDDCKVDVCMDVGGVPNCMQVNAPDGTPCQDGDLCIVSECMFGMCQPVGPTDCDDEIPCTIDGCDSMTGCTHTPDDAFCDDGIDCTVCSCNTSEGCLCFPDHDLCDDGFDCTQDKCSLSVGCVNTRLNSRCDNGDDCDGKEICLPDSPNADSEGCVPGVPLQCNDNKVCTEDSCVEGFGCFFDSEALDKL